MHTCYIAQHHVSWAWTPKKKPPKPHFTFQQLGINFDLTSVERIIWFFLCVVQRFYQSSSAKRFLFRIPPPFWRSGISHDFLAAIFLLRRKRRLHAWIPSFPRSFAWSFQQTAHPQASKGAKRFRAAGFHGNLTVGPLIESKRMVFFRKMVTVPETNTTPANWWLEYYFPFGKPYFQVLF